MEILILKIHVLDVAGPHVIALQDNFSSQNTVLNINHPHRSKMYNFSLALKVAETIATPGLQPYLAAGRNVSDTAGLYSLL